MEHNDKQHQFFSTKTSFTLLEIDMNVSSMTVVLRLIFIFCLKSIRSAPNSRLTATTTSSCLAFVTQHEIWISKNLNYVIFSDELTKVFDALKK